MIHLRGLRFNNTKSHLRVFWNPHIPYEVRERMNKKVYQQLDKSKCSRGSYYDKIIDKKLGRNLINIDVHRICLYL